MEKIVSYIDLTKEYGAFPALAGVSLSLYAGRIVAVLGDTGSGKSTLLKLTAGVTRPTDGDVLVCCSEPSEYSRELTAYLPDHDTLPPQLTASAAVRLYGRYFEDLDSAKAMKLLSACGIDLLKPLGRMSRGNRAAVQLLLALSRKAKLFLLDEPFLSLDSIQREVLVGEVKKHTENGACAVMTAHTPDELPCEPDDLLVLRSGTVLAYGAFGEVELC